MNDDLTLNDGTKQCPYCRAENPTGVEACVECGKSIADEDWMSGTLLDSETIDAPPTDQQGETSLTVEDQPSDSQQPATPGAKGAPPSEGPASKPTGGAAPAGAHQPGTVLGQRYRIEEFLGFGGMGSVYRAFDLELEREVALKVIRPHLADDPNVLARFKQEIILSREVTHRNVVRIFDMGQAEDTRFISMEFVEGTNLHALLKERGALPAEEVIEIVEQICLALDAAHQQGVVHRDLKPANIMIEPDGRVVVMDFGIARSLEISGMTQTGSLLGTPDYMSPEQVKGQPVDARSDLFALGIILYQLLTGELPYKGETPMAAMYTRTQTRPAPVRDLNPDLPGFLGDVVAHCLEIAVHKRYQSAREILQDLAVLRGGSTHMTIGPTMRGLMPSTTAARKRFRLAAIGSAAVVAVAVVAAGVLWLRGRAPTTEGEGSATVAPTEVVSLAILPFQNASGDPELTWLGSGLAEMLRTDVGQTASLRTVSSDRLHQVLRDLRIEPDSSLEEVTLRRVAEFANAGTVVWGQYLKFGEQIRIDATVRDFERHQTANLKAEAANEQQLLRAVQELAQGVRDNLALSRKAVKEAEAQAFIPSASSMVALRHYTEGLELMRQGNNLDAVTAFESAIEGDPEFALAHSTLAQAYLNLGRGQKAEEASRTAVDLSEDLPSQERYLILAQNARVESDYETGIDVYQNLLQTRPTDAELNYEIALLYEKSGELELARQHLGTALESDPQNVTAQLAMGKVLMKSGQSQQALAPLNQALSLAIQMGNQEARANALQNLGIAYSILGRQDEALENLDESLEIQRGIGDQRGMAISLSEIGYIRKISGQFDDARDAMRQAIEICREIGDDSALARFLVNLGDVENLSGNMDQALQYTREALRIHMEAGDEENKAWSLNNIGTIYDRKGEYAEALIYYQQALDIRQRLQDRAKIADTLHNMAETYKWMGSFRESIDHYMRALENRRQAADEFGAAIELYSLGRVYDLQGRYKAALESSEEAIEILRRLEEHGSWYVEILAGHGDALSQLGRFDEAEPILQEALELAREQEDVLLEAMTLKYQGDRLLYSGDFDGAREVYRQARTVAEAAGDPYLILATKADAARADLMAGRPQQAIPVLEETLDEASNRGVAFLEARCNVCLGSALLATGDVTAAEERSRTALRGAENLGSQTLIAQSHYLLAQALRSRGSEQDAARHAARAKQALDEIRSEAGTDAVLERADLHPIAETGPADK